MFRWMVWCANGLVEVREASFLHSSMAPVVIVIVVVVIDRSRVHVHMPMSYRASKGTPRAPQHTGNGLGMQPAKGCESAGMQQSVHAAKSWVRSS